MDCTRSETKQTTVNQKHFNHIYNIRGIAHNYVKIFKKLILVPQNQFTHLQPIPHLPCYTRGVSSFGITKLATLMAMINSFSSIMFSFPNFYFEISTQ